MNDKFKLTREENVFLAKKLLVNSIYIGARIEGINVTFPQTDAIVNGINVPGLTVDEILVIRNLRNAWQYTLKNIDKPFDIDFVNKINEDVSRNESLAWGTLRTGNVGISGTNWVPPIPDARKVAADIAKIMSLPTATDKAIEYYLYGCRNQLYWDGNKRTTFIASNKILISEGAGLLQIKDADFLEFNTLLTEYYSTGEGNLLRKFLYEKCLTGITY